MAESSPNPDPDRTTGTPRPRGRKAFLVAAGVLSFLLAAGSGFAIGTIRYLEKQLSVAKVESGPSCQGSGCLKSVTPICDKGICNFLILGSDTRAGLSKQQQAQFGTAQPGAGQRADTIIVAQVDPIHHRTIVLSIPRDLLVPIPGHGMNKINTAFNYGPNVMVQTVQQLTGLRINHYAEVNFVGFQDLVNALGGVPICIAKPMIDTLASLNLPRAGCYNLRGAQALGFVRARHIQGDVIPDFSRIARQQQFTRAVIHKALSIGAVFKIPQLVAAAKHNLVIDSHLNLYSLQDLTQRLSGLGQGGVDFRVVPAVPVQIGGIDYVQLVQPQASQLFERIRDGKGLGSIGKEAPGTAISTANITVQVYDANSGGKAEQVVSYLDRAGFVVLALRQAPAGLTKSVLLWGHGSGKPEGVLASYLTTVPAFYDNAHTRGSIMTVVIASDFRGLPG